MDLTDGGQQGIPMDRTYLLIAGVICWTVALGDAAIHLINGDLLVPAVFVAVFAAWVGVRLFLSSGRSSRAEAYASAD